MSVRQRSSAIHLRAIIARCARLAARLDAAGLKNNHRGLREHGEQNEKQKKQTKKDRRAQYMTRVRQNCQREPESLVTSWISQCLPGSAGTMHEGGLLIAIPAKHADFTAVSRMQRPVTPFLPHNLNMNLTGIVTDEWNRLLAHCVETGWQCVFSYDMFDKGIDYDLYILVRSGEEIRFGWDNWFEGEIQCSPQLRTEMEGLLGHALEEGEPSTLKSEVVEIVTGGRYN